MTLFGTTVGVDYLIIPNSEGDDYHGVSVSVGKSKLPFWFDYHAQEGYTKNIMEN